MMKTSVYDLTGKSVGKADLPDDIFNVEPNVGLMHQALVRQMANARAGTHKTKQRSEINKTGAKLYRQKGTGNARHGSKRAPIFVGGGVAHGPRPRDYSKKMPKKMRRGALRCALSAKAKAGDVVILDGATLSEPKTKTMAQAKADIVGKEHSALVLITEANENVELSTRNVGDMKPLRAGYLNIRDILGHNKVMISREALDEIVSHLGNKGDE